MKDFFNGFLNKVLFPTLKFRIYTVIFILFMMLCTYLVVLQTGGTQYVFTHFMYIPIILAGTILGIYGGAISAIFSGILLGPFMPLDTNTNEPQLLVNWISRVTIFLIVGSFSGIFSNIFKKNLKKILHAHNFNQDTGLPNINHMDAFVTLKKKDQIKTKLYMTIMINNYESIFDLIGHEHYTELLKTAYKRITEHTPESTMIFQSDMRKFWLYLTDELDESRLNNLSHMLNNTYHINNIPIYVEFTIGVAKHIGASTNDQLKYADTAAYFAQQVKKPYGIYQASSAYTNLNIELLGEFNAALKNNELELHFQPILQLVDQKMTGLEALLRWHHPTRGNISPTSFIELVEETQMINPLTEWVLRQALVMLEKLDEAGISTNISINLSAKNLQSAFIENIATILNNHPLAYLIEFEITESALMDDPDACQILLEKMRIQGIQLSIDDFGTGYSSLTYLSRFPIQVVKIDQYFIKMMLSDVGIYHIVKSTVDLGHKLGMKVLAEGVEQKNIEQLLIDIKCDFVQGYYYAKPMNATDMINWYLQHIHTETVKK